jgi:long-chain acyl-CoA synthetase
MASLQDFFDRHIRGHGIALIHDDGLRRWSYSHDWLREAAEAFAARLHEAGLRPGDRLAIWSENRPEWVAAFWGCVLQGVVVIPIDPRASAALALRLIAAGDPRGLLAGDDLPSVDVPAAVFSWRIRDLRWSKGSGPASPSVATAPHPPRAPASPDTVAEIVFTSGTTGEPKGVLITHGNILANIAAIEPEAVAYRRYLLPFRPLRFLCLLPLSHMFGQALTIFLPPAVRASAVFVKGHNPDEIVAHVRRHRITLVVTVPRMLEMLQARVRARVPSCASPDALERSVPARVWKYRDARLLFWWRFCGFVVGGAQLDPDLEDFWRRLGFVVVQGYGLTETAPMAAWNHPFRTQRGTVGKPLAGVEIRIADDGEVLVRGPVVTAGYLNQPELTRAALEDGWLHTGDLGSFDATGHLQIRGRKKDMIATPDGMKVFPEDVERVLDSLKGVRESAVVGRRVEGAEQVHAVLVLAPGVQAEDVVRDANTRLEPFQRIRSVSVWPGAALPRTEAIRKIKHHEIRGWVEAGSPLPAEPQPTGDDLARLIARYSAGRPVGEETTFDELGLASLDRIELVAALEDRANVTLSEAEVGGVRTVGQLRQAIEHASERERAGDEMTFPKWNRTWLSRVVRNISQATWVLPLSKPFMPITVRGRHHLADLQGPVIFAPNHQSHFDGLAVLRALPGRWRRWVAVSMWKEFFDAHFYPERHTAREHIGNSILYFLLAQFGNAFPLPVVEPRMRDTVRYIGDLVTDGFSILIYPEGERTDHGEIKRFHPGVGLLASRLKLPVVPIRLEGVDHVLHRKWRWPRRHAVTVTIGAPLTLEGDDYAALARRVEEAVRALGPTPPA